MKPLRSVSPGIGDTAKKLNAHLWQHVAGNDATY